MSEPPRRDEEWQRDFSVEKRITVMLGERLLARLDRYINQRNKKFWFRKRGPATRSSVGRDAIRRFLDEVDPEPETVQSEEAIEVEGYEIEGPKKEIEPPEDMSDDDGE